MSIYDRKTETPDPGEWEVDERGRRYRELGKGCIEFEPTVSINGLEIPQSELPAYNAARRAAQERAAKNTAAAENAVHSRKNCPFSSGCDTTCTGEKCGLFLNGACAISTIADATGAEVSTNGKRCPFSPSAHCGDCALYASGCAIVRIAAACKK